MKLLVNADVIRSNAIDVIRDKNNTILKIKYFENKIPKEYVFEIPYNIMYRLNVIQGLSKNETDDGCKFIYTENEDDESVYAIFHSEQIYPSDIFVPLYKREQVEIIKKFNYTNFNEEYGKYASSIYFVRLKVEDFKPLSIYTGPKNSNMQNKHFEIHKLNGSISIKRKWENNSKFVHCISLDDL